MAKNNLRPEQDLLTREFFMMVMNDEAYLRNDPASRRGLIQGCLQALNYNMLANGSFVAQGTNISIPFGSTIDYSKYPNEWNEDKERAIAQINLESEFEASASEPPKDTEVQQGESVLPEDVY